MAKQESKLHYKENSMNISHTWIIIGTTIRLKEDIFTERGAQKIKWIIRMCDAFYYWLLVIHYKYLSNQLEYSY